MATLNYVILQSSPGGMLQSMLGWPCVVLSWNPEDPVHVFPESEDLEIHPSETHGLWMRFFITRRLDGLSSWNPEAGRSFVLEPRGWTDFRLGTRRLDGLSSWNPEAGWTFVLEPGGWMDLRPGTQRLVELLSRNLMFAWTFKGTFSYIVSTRSCLRRVDSR